MILLLIYTYYIYIKLLITYFIRVLILPVRLAFESDPNSMLPLDITVDSLFFIDIVMNFITAFEDERGIVIVDKKKIAQAYLKGWFLIDFVSTIPTYAINYIISD